MSLSTVFFIRHGETDYNLQERVQGSINAPLNSTGVLQSVAIGAYLKRYRIDRVVCSGLQRTHQTAEPVLRHFGLDTLCSPDLDELNFGEFEGLSFNEVKLRLQELKDQWATGLTDVPLPGGESPMDAFRRADSSVRGFLEQYQGENIAFFVHGRLIRILLSEWTGIGMKNMHQIEHVNGSINRLTWNGSGFEAGYLNKTDHLGGFMPVLQQG